MYLGNIEFYIDLIFSKKTNSTRLESKGLSLEKLSFIPYSLEPCPKYLLMEDPKYPILAL